MRLPAISFTFVFCSIGIHVSLVSSLLFSVGNNLKNFSPGFLYILVIMYYLGSVIGTWMEGLACFWRK